MGNRGRLNDNNGVIRDHGVIRRLWQTKRWLICLLEFDGRHRQVMAPDRYTELFFLDEATALAAVRRPCFECRRGAYNALADAWAVGNGIGVTDGRPTAASMDDRLNEERVSPGRSEQTFVEKIDGLPDGVYVRMEQEEDRPYLLCGWPPPRLVARWLHGRLSIGGRRGGLHPHPEIDGGCDAGGIQA